MVEFTIRRGESTKGQCAPHTSPSECSGQDPLEPNSTEEQVMTVPRFADGRHLPTRALGAIPMSVVVVIVIVARLYPAFEVTLRLAR
jgi:hypothetical protein